MTKEEVKKLNRSRLLGKVGYDSLKGKACQQLTEDGEVIETFGSALQASIKTGICHSSISRCCRGLMPLAGGYKWQYTENTPVQTTSFLRYEGKTYVSENALILRWGKKIYRYFNPRSYMTIMWGKKTLKLFKIEVLAKIEESAVFEQLYLHNHKNLPEPLNLNKNE